MLVTRLYSVHLNPRDPRPYESAVFVPDGFNIYAFIFGVFWALYHRIWLPAFIFFMLTVVVMLVGDHIGLSLMSSWIMQVGIRLMIALAANDLWRDTLERRGFIISDVVIADSRLEAERRYFDRHIGQFEPMLTGVNITA